VDIIAHGKEEVNVNLIVNDATGCRTPYAYVYGCM